MLRLAALLLVCCGAVSTASAQVPTGEVPVSVTGVRANDLEPGSSTATRQTYLRLRRDPFVALGYEALLPGGGSLYNGIYVHAIVGFSVSCLGAVLWTAGALIDSDPLRWAGALSFGIGRAYGLLAAPLGAALLNAVFRRQLGVAYRL